MRILPFKKNLNRAQQYNKTKEKSVQVTDTSTRDDTKEVSHESSHPKVLQKSISKPKQSDKEST